MADGVEVDDASAEDVPVEVLAAEDGTEILEDFHPQQWGPQLRGHSQPSPRQSGSDHHC